MVTVYKYIFVISNKSVYLLLNLYLFLFDERFGIESIFIRLFFYRSYKFNIITFIIINIRSILSVTVVIL